MLSATVEVAGVSGDKVILKSREVMSGDRQYEKSEELRNEFITVNEDNALFKVNLYDYLDTGLFLDGRLIRKLIREKSQGKSVLNLFAYTCSASVAAALGGATRVVSVDMSKTYLNWGMDNFKLNSLSLDNTDFIQADCLAWLSKDQEEKFDLIYIDPPTFSNSKRMESSFDVKRDHVQLLANLTRHLKDGGEVIFCNNMRGFVLDESISEYGFSFENISEKTLPRDFARDKKIHTCYRLVFNRADMVKQPEPMTSGKAAPKWQKSLSAKSDTYHDYTDRNDYEESVRETLTNKVWGNAKASTSSYKTQKQGRFTRSDSEFNSDSPRRNRFEDGKSGRFSRDRKENNRGFGSKSRTAKRKPRVFGPDGIKDL